jgi:2-oxoglutarate ferredoxin oxidoreductase subunit alpha
MGKTRAAKIAGIANDIPDLEIEVGDPTGKLLVLGWGSTYGSIREAVQRCRDRGLSVSHAHLRWLSPLEPGLEKIIRNFKHVLVAELNMGQLDLVVRAKFLIDTVGLNKIQGLPFKVREVAEAIEKLFGGTAQPNTDADVTQPVATA